MKKNFRALALLLALAVMITFMPAMAFAGTEAEGAAEADVTLTAAEDVTLTAAAEPYPKSVKAEYPNGSTTGTIGTKLGNLNVPGAKITITLSNGKTKKFVYKPWDEKNDYDSGFYLDGNYNKEYITELYDLWIEVNSGRIKPGSNSGTLYVCLEDTDDYETEPDPASCSLKITGVESDDVAAVSYEHVSGRPVSGKVNYNTKSIDYLVNSDDESNDAYAELEGDTITITRFVVDEYGNKVPDPVNGGYQTEPEPEVYTCTLVQGENGDYYTFVRESENEYDDYDSEGVDRLDPEFYDDQYTGNWVWASGSLREVTVAYDGVDAPQKLQVQVPEYAALKSADLVLTSGFMPRISIYQDEDVTQDAFFGAGNKFVVTYTDGSKKTYNYNDKKGAFINSGDYAEFSSPVSASLKKGARNFTFTFLDDNDLDSIEFTKKINVCRYEVYAVKTGRYVYTGKVIKPLVTMKSSYNGLVSVPAKALSYTAPKNIKIGHYGFDVTIKDTSKFYCTETKAGNKTRVEYVICPKKAYISKVKSEKRAATVTWAKLSKSEQKDVDGIMIEYSLNKNFSKSKTVKASKKASSKKIKKLTSKKQYYFRVFRYKKVKYTKLVNGKKKTVTETLKSPESGYICVKIK